MIPYLLSPRKWDLKKKTWETREVTWVSGIQSPFKLFNNPARSFFFYLLTVNISKHRKVEGSGNNTPQYGTLACGLF